MQKEARKNPENYSAASTKKSVASEGVQEGVVLGLVLDLKTFGDVDRRIRGSRRFGP